MFSKDKEKRFIKLWYIKLNKKVKFHGYKIIPMEFFCKFIFLDNIKFKDKIRTSSYENQMNVLKLFYWIKRFIGKC